MALHSRHEARPQSARACTFVLVGDLDTLGGEHRRLLLEQVELGLLEDAFEVLHRESLQFDADRESALENTREK